MKRETMIWTVILGIGVLLLAIRMMVWGGIGKSYVRTVDKEFVQVDRPITEGDKAGTTETVWLPSNTPEATAAGVVRTSAPPVGWTKTEHAPMSVFNSGEKGVDISYTRTMGIWFSAFLTLCIFSFLYRDNAFYKLSESIFIGVSAAYWMVVGFWSVIVPNLLGNIAPTAMQAWAMPGLENDQPKFIYIVPLILAVMLLWRLMPVGAWVSRWPLAFFIGVFAGLRMIQFIQADFLNQIRNGILPLVVREGNAIAWGTSLWNIVSVLGVLACLTYFFFSVEHKGAVGRVARVGTWILMITFGAMFAFTVMGRIALLTGRLEFLFIDWLWLIDPTGTRA